MSMPASPHRLPALIRHLARNPARRVMPALLAVLLLGGCGGYRISGRVLEGPYGTVEFVSGSSSATRTADSASDTASGTAAVAAARGIDGARIAIYRDGGRINESFVGTFRSEEDGAIDIELDSFGAGWLEEVWRIEVVRPGYETVSTITELPAASAGRKLLVTMRRGASTAPAPTLLEQYEKYK